jgi:hypothetical protein
MSGRSVVGRVGAQAGCRFVARALVLLWAFAALGGDWPQFRGPNGAGRSQDLVEVVRSEQGDLGLRGEVPSFPGHPRSSARELPLTPAGASCCAD